MLNRIIELLSYHKHEVRTWFRNSDEIMGHHARSAGAFFSGIYSFRSRKMLRALLRQQQPDVVQIQNVFPLISPSVLSEVSAQQIPVVMRCANYRLICPNGLLTRAGQVCEECTGGHEWRCVFRNCERSLPKSIGYAIRNYVARRLRLFLDNVTMYICQTHFQKAKLAEYGVPADRMVVIPNMTDPAGEPSDSAGDYVGYVGRASLEKGITVFLQAAHKADSIAFRVAGSLARMPEIADEAPSNITFSGHLPQSRLNDFYRGCRILVVPSVCYEGFPSVIIDAMIHGKPVICSNIGGLPEIVADGITGLLFEPGNAEDLAEKIQHLWDRPKLCREMGQAGRKKALREYSPEKYYERLMMVYQKAIELGPGGPKR